ncbi:hypothetical protein CIK05_07430 [Bdellovibrio sp. qaytius]|nr:hypothetical protein CIK05_07430 [Bdellovibrio sp. qaytius]
MTKFLTVMTILGLVAFKSYGADLQSLAQKMEQFKQVKQTIQEMESVYDNGSIKLNVKNLRELNDRAMQSLGSCQKTEAEFQAKAPEVLSNKITGRERAFNQAKSLLDTRNDADMRTAQENFVRVLVTAKYCLGLTSQIVSSEVSGAAN